MQDNGTTINGPEPWTGVSMRSLSARSNTIWGAKGGAVGVLVSLVLSGCADMAVFHTPATFVGIATNPGEGRDFVKQSRPENIGFTAVGVETAQPPDKPRDAAGIKQLQAELEAQRAAGHALIQSMSPQPVATAPSDPKEKDKVKKKKPDEAKKQDKQAQDSAEAPR
jgi:hypothetical protein